MSIIAKNTKLSKEIKNNFPVDMYVNICMPRAESVLGEKVEPSYDAD